MRRLLPLLALSAALVSTGAVASPISCSVGLHRATTAELFFGCNIEDNGVVSEADWGQFVDAEVTPRFPDGEMMHGREAKHNVSPRRLRLAQRGVDGHCHRLASSV